MATPSRLPSHPQDIRACRPILDVLLEQIPLDLLRYLDAEAVRRDQSTCQASACTTKDVRNSTEKPARRDGGRSLTQASSTDSRGLGIGNGNRLYFSRLNPLGSKRQYSSLGGFNDGNFLPNPLTTRIWQVTPCAEFGRRRGLSCVNHPYHPMPTVRNGSPGHETGTDLGREKSPGRSRGSTSAQRSQRDPQGGQPLRGRQPWGCPPRLVAST